MFNQAPFLGQVRLRPALGCGGWIVPPPGEEHSTVQVQEPSQMMGCDRHHAPVMGCPKCRRKKKDWTLVSADEVDEASSEMLGVRRTRRILIGDARHPHYLGQSCPAPGGSADPSTFGPDVACQRTASGDIICSNNVIYTGSCPNAPAVNVPGVAGNIPGTNIPQAPAPLGAATASAATPYAAPGTVPAASSILPTLGIAAGGLAVAGLAYALFLR
jgi:hypothetical protein